MRGTVRATAVTGPSRFVLRVEERDGLRIAPSRTHTGEMVPSHTVGYGLSQGHNG